MSTKHTPGPWRIAEGNERANTGRHFIWSDAESREEREDGSPYCIATIQPRTDASQLDANARLIAAAPDLAEALKMLLAAIPDDDSTWSKEMGMAIATALDAQTKAGL
jgi:hypothetical protein